MIAAICRRLDGIPLAIELAAASAAVFGIEEVATHLGDRFRILTGGRRTALPRHQTLRAALDWSYELLSEPEHAILRRLAVFTGAFSLDAASAVIASGEITPAEIVDGTANLVAKSLVTAVAGATIARCRLLDTMRAYALEKLAESGERQWLARRHAEYYRDLFERAEAELDARPATEWLAEYGPNTDNLRAALDWALSPEAIPRLAWPWQRPRCRSGSKFHPLMNPAAGWRKPLPLLTELSGNRSARWFYSTRWATRLCSHRE